jgi:DNA primase
MNREHARRVLDFQEIQRLVPMVAVLERYGLLAELKRTGRQLKGRCPLHKGKSPKAFVVDPHKNVWRCFGDCDRGGSTLELVAALEGVEIRQAAEMIARWFAIAPSRSASSQHGKRRSKPMTETNRPTHKVYSAQKREGQKDFLTRVGSAWPFSMKDGKSGLNIQLSALPIGDRMVLFEYDDEEPEAQEQPEKKGNGRRK